MCCTTGSAPRFNSHHFIRGRAPGVPLTSAGVTSARLELAQPFSARFFWPGTALAGADLRPLKKMNRAQA
jgi:hypothetical protein